jgi:hypothetical protein
VSRIIPYFCWKATNWSNCSKDFVLENNDLNEKLINAVVFAARAT